MRSREESCFRGIHPSPPVPSEKRVPFWCGERGGRTGAPRRPPCSETMVPCENGSSQATGACRGGGRGVRRRPGGGPRAGAASSVCPAFASAPQEDDPQSPVPTAPPHWWKANSSLRRIGSISLTRWLEACAEATSVHPRGARRPEVRPRGCWKPRAGTPRFLLPPREPGGHYGDFLQVSSADLTTGQRAEPGRHLVASAFAMRRDLPHRPRASGAARAPRSARGVGAAGPWASAPPWRALSGSGCRTDFSLETF